MTAATGTDECVDCGLVFENPHGTCQGHQWCMPECPRCGGELKPYDDRPRCEWCGEPDDPELGNVAGEGLLFHPDCRTTWEQRVGPRRELFESVDDWMDRVEGVTE